MDESWLKHLTHYSTVDTDMELQRIIDWTVNIDKVARLAEDAKSR